VIASLRPPGRVARLLGWTWRALWLTLALLILVHYLVSSSADRRLHWELSERRRTGQLPAVEELIPHLPAGAKNAADIYQRAFSALALSSDQRDLLLGEGDFLWWIPPKPPQEWNHADFVAAAAAVARNARYLQLLQDASQIPDCVFRIGWHRGHMTSLPHLPGLLWAGLMLRARAVILTRQAKWEEALSSCSAIFRIADHVEREPALISQHVGYCLQAMGVDALEYALCQGEPTADTCQRLFDQLGTIDLVFRSLRAMQGEQTIYGLPSFDSERFRLPAVSSAAENRPLLARLAPGLMQELDELSYLEYAKQAGRALALPWPACQEAAGQADQEVERLPDYRSLVTKWVAPPILPELLHRQETIASIGAARIALALRLYRLQHQRYPDSLAELAAASGQLPSDPFTQQPYHCRRQGPGFIVYSVGPDMRDDAGRPLPGGPLRGLMQDQAPNALPRYDLSFRCAR
jgi:hypothetical protein